MVVSRWAAKIVKIALKFSFRFGCGAPTPRNDCLRFVIGGSGLVLGFHRDGNRERLFQSHTRSLESILLEEAERRKTTPTNKVKAFFRDVFRLICVVLRTLEMLVLILPLLISGPLAVKSQTFRENHWFRMLLLTIERCGPVYVKLGQWAATRRDLFPPAMCEQLAKLQRHAQEHDWSHTQRVLEQVLGSKRVSDVFKQFDPEPVGSGCCAQVYRAVIDLSKLQGGGDGLLPVAVKVLHPNIKQRFQRDLQVLGLLERLLSTLFPSLKWLSLKNSLEEFAFSMNVQLDLTSEAENMMQFRKDFANSKNQVVFPRPILDLCYPEIMVQTYEHGIHLGQLLLRENELPEKVRKRLADIGVDLLLQMVFKHNYVHADLHPGNILVRGIDQDDMKLVILDSGIVATLDKKDFGNFYSTFTAIVKGDGRQVGKLFLERSINNCQDPASFIDQMDVIVTNAVTKQLSLFNVNVTDLLVCVFQVLRDHQVKLDANFASVILAIMILEGLGRSLDPNLDLVRKATPYLLESKLNDLYTSSS